MFVFEAIDVRQSQWPSSNKREMLCCLSATRPRPYYARAYRPRLMWPNGRMDCLVVVRKGSVFFFCMLALCMRVRECVCV